MKLSLMNNEQATDFLIRTSKPIANIMEDEAVNDLFNQVKDAKGQTVSKLIANLLPKVVPDGLSKNTTLKGALS